MGVSTSSFRGCEDHLVSYGAFRIPQLTTDACIPTFAHGTWVWVCAVCTRPYYCVCGLRGALKRQYTYDGGFGRGGALD